MLPRFVLQLEENLVEKPWGGDFIAKLKGVNAERIGESWEFSAHPSRPSVVNVDGGISLIELVNRYGSDVINGHDHYPILVKIIDANENLSVQVHPSERHARMLGENDHGKPEAWVVIDAERDAKIYLGFSRDISREEVIRGVKEGWILEALNEIRVKKGDSFYIPPGTVHALGKGVRVLEVSTNSNVTYRIYDYGRGRELHLDKALRVMNMRRLEVEELRQRGRQLDGILRVIDTAYFKVDRVMGNVKVEKDDLQILTCINGSVRLKSGDEELEIAKGRSVLIPALTASYEIETSDDAEVYIVSPGEL